MSDNTQKLNVHLKGEVADKFSRIKKLLGLEQDTEVIRTLITWYYNMFKDEMQGPPKTMWHINLNSEGVLIWDPDLHKAIQLSFTPEGILCQEDKSGNCRHIHFALSKPDIREVIRQRKKEGWNLPEI